MQQFNFFLSQNLKKNYKSEEELQFVGFTCQCARIHSKCNAIQYVIPNNQKCEVWREEMKKRKFNLMAHKNVKEVCLESV